LETLQRNASRLLIEGEEEVEARRKHLEYFTRMAEEAHEERVTSPEKWIIVLQTEHENILAALVWADLHDPERYRMLAGSFSWFWVRNSHFTTARKFLEKVVTGKVRNEKALARAFTGYGILLSTGDSLQRALTLLNQALLLWRNLKNPKEEALVLTELAYAYMYTGKDDDSAVELAKKAFVLAQQLNDPGTELHCLGAVAQCLVMLKNTAEARPVATALLEIAQQMEIPLCIYGSHHLLGDCAIIEERYAESEREYGQSLINAYKFGDTFQTCVEMVGLSMALAGQGRYAKALRLNATASRIAKELGYLIPEDSDVVFWKELVDKHIVETRNRVGETLTLKCEEEGRAFSLEEAVDYALDFEKD
jgi:tetratricopeptide (TPR) repeat protein